MVRMSVVAKVQSGKREEFLDAMAFLTKERLLERGIRRSHTYECREDPFRFMIIAEWETERDLQKYLGNEGFKVLLGALRTLCTEAKVIYAPIEAEKNWLSL